MGKSKGQSQSQTSTGSPSTVKKTLDSSSMVSSDEEPIKWKIDPASSYIEELARRVATGEIKRTEEFLDEDGKWHCTKCGACCLNISWCMPHNMVEGTTRCKYLDTDTMECTIYEDRPKICRVDAWERNPPPFEAMVCAAQYEMNIDERTTTDSE
jgi:hypothetical protein